MIIWFGFKRQNLTQTLYAPLITFSRNASRCTSGVLLTAIRALYSDASSAAKALNLQFEWCSSNFSNMNYSSKSAGTASLRISTSPVRSPASRIEAPMTYFCNRSPASSCHFGNVSKLCPRICESAPACAANKADRKFPLDC